MDGKSGFAARKRIRAKLWLSHSEGAMPLLQRLPCDSGHQALHELKLLLRDPDATAQLCSTLESSHPPPPRFVRQRRSRLKMPGELLPTMAAPAVAKLKLSRGKPDLYLIVSSAESYETETGNPKADSSNSPRKTRFTSRISWAIREV